MATVSSTIKIVNGFSGPLNQLNAGLSKSQSAFGRLKSALSSSGSFDGLKKQAVKTNGMFKSMLGGTVIGAGITKGIGLITNSVDDAIKRVDTLNNATRSFVNMGFSKGQTSQAMAALDKGITGLPTAMNDAVSNTQLLAASTGNLGKSTKIFKAMNDGILGFGGNANQVNESVTQLSQAFSNGKVDAQTWNSMINGGMGPALNAIAKQMGITTGKLKDGLSSGKISAEKFQDALIDLDEKGGGGMKSLGKIAQDSTKGIGTALTNFKTAVTRVVAGGFDALSKAGLTDGINEITNKLKSSIPTIQGMLMTGVDFVKNSAMKMFDGFKNTGALDSVKDMFGDLGKSISAIFDSAFAGGGNPFESIGQFAGGAVKGVAKSISAIAKVIGGLDPNILKGLGAAFIVLKSGMKGLVFTAVLAGLNGLSKLKPGTLNKLAFAVSALAIAFSLFKSIKGIADTFSSISGAFGKSKGGGTDIPVPEPEKTAASARSLMQMGAALMMVGAGVALAGGGLLLIAMATQKIASGGGASIAVFFGMFIALALLMGVVKLLGPEFIAGAAGFLIFGAALLLIGVAVFVAAAGLALLATQLPNIAQYGLTAAINLLALAGAVAVFGLAAIVGAIGLLLLGVALAVVGVGFLIGAVGALLFGVALAIIGVGAMVAAIGMLLLGVALAMVAVFTMVAAVGMLLMAVALVLISAVVLIAAVGMMLFAVALIMAAPLMMIAAVGALLLGVAAIILGVGLLIVGAALMVVATGLMMVSAAVIALATAFIMAGTMMVSAITSAMSRVVSAVSNGIQNAVNAAKGFVNSLVSVGKDLIQGLVNGIKSMIGSAVSAVKSVAGKVVDAAKSVLHIGSPSKLFKQYGRWVDQGLIIGLNRDAGSAANASANMAQGVVDAASNMTPTLNPLTMGLSTNPGDLLANGFDRALGSVNAVSNAISGIAGNTSIGINGNINSSDSIDSPFDGPGSTFGISSSNGSSTSNNSSVVIENGAIQINSTGNADYDAETLVSKIENYLINLNDKSL